MRSQARLYIPQARQLQEAWAECDPNPAGSARDVDLALVVQIGWAAAAAGCHELAGKCASRAAASQDIGPRTWAELIRAQVSLLGLAAG